MPDSSVPTRLRVTDLGRMTYAVAYDIQQRTNRAVSQHQSSPTVYLVEHDPVITISHRRGVESHLLTSRDRLERMGIDVQPTDRGGDITYHGPGQLVVYPIVRLNELGLNLGRYMRTLEQLVIDTVAEFGITGYRQPGATGVWVDEPKGGAVNGGSAKLCAMGVRIRKNTTMHGLALNVNPDLRHFQTIVPCGLQDSSVTSLAQQLNDHVPSMERVKRVMENQLHAYFCRGAEHGRVDCL